MQIRTVAAIIVWVVVALLLLNRIFMYDWVLPVALILTLAAVLLYFSPRILKKKKQETTENQPLTEHQQL